MTDLVFKLDPSNIIPALNACANGNCGSCPYRKSSQKFGPFGCITRITRWALESISELSIESKGWKDRGDALEKALNVAFADFAEFEKNHSWISVDRQLPERGEWVLAYRELFGSIWPAYLIGDNMWMNEAGEAHHVTHWMSMPAPPKDET